MQIDISGHHVDVTDGIRESIHNKFHKIEAHYPDLNAITIILEVERNEQKVEVNTQYLGAPISVHAIETDLYVAIGEAAKKLDAALSHRKGVVKANKHGQSARL